MDARQMLGFTAFSQGAQGFLFHNARVDYASLISSDGAYTNCKPQCSFPRGPGDGALYLRGPQGPLPSARLEAIRDGLEDYDYLYIAREFVAKVEAKNISTPDLDRLAGKIRPYFSPGNKLVSSVTKFSQDPAELEEARRLVAGYIVLSRGIQK